MLKKVVYVALLVSDQVLEFPWGSVARFQDPDGNRLQVREGRGEFRL
jgi:predicted enzyme related to lactoylglutathione lyase